MGYTIGWKIPSEGEQAIVLPVEVESSGRQKRYQSDYLCKTMIGRGSISIDPFSWTHFLI